MYAVSKGPSKLVAKTRSGLNQAYQQSSETCGSASIGGGIYESDISGAKPVFQKYRRSHSSRNHYGTDYYSPMNEFQLNEPPSPQYEELIKYIRDSWDGLSSEGTIECAAAHQSTDNGAKKQLKRTENDNHRKLKKKIVVYHNDPPSPELRDFGAFDLESWWGRRLFINITKSL